MAGLALLVSAPVYGQSVENLKRDLADKEIEIQRLRERLKTLERETNRAAPANATAAGPGAADDEEDGRRGLERALVREGGLLLSPGRYEIEPNFVYSHLSDADSRRDSYGPGLTLRAGLPWRWQIEASLPYVFEELRNSAMTTRSSGIGDLTLGLSHHLLDERRSVPAVIADIAYRASTGRNTVFESATPVALGSGFDAAQVSINAVKRLAPLVVFGGYTYTHSFPETRAGSEVDPGSSHGLRFGTLLAASPESSLRAVYNLTFYDSTTLGGVPIAGSSDPAALLELGATFTLTDRTALDVLVGAGLTRTEPDYRIAIALPVRF